MTDSLRDRIAAVACGATSAGKLFPWDTLSEAQRDSWRKVADAVIAALNFAQACEGGCVWQIPNHYEDMTPQQQKLLERDNGE